MLVLSGCTKPKDEPVATGRLELETVPIRLPVLMFVKREPSMAGNLAKLFNCTN